MVGHGGSSADSYLADPTSPIPSHCASIVVTSTLRVNHIAFRIKIKHHLSAMHLYHDETEATFPHLIGLTSARAGQKRDQKILLRAELPAERCLLIIGIQQTCQRARGQPQLNILSEGILL